MRTQHTAAIDFRSVHHTSDSGNSISCFADGCRHGRWTKSRYAFSVQIPAHRPDSILSLHGIMLSECMNMDIHKSRQNHIALYISNLLIQAGFKLISYFMNLSIKNANIRSFYKLSIHKEFAVTDDHCFFPHPSNCNRMKNARRTGIFHHFI